MNDLGTFIDEKILEYEREDNENDMPIKEKTIGQYLAPLIYLWFERKYDRR